MLAFPLLVATIGAPSALLVRSRDGSVALGFDGGTRSAADRTVDIGGTRRTTHGAVGVPSGGQAHGGDSGFVPGWTTVGLTWAGSSGVFSGRQLVFFFFFYARPRQYSARAFRRTRFLANRLVALVPVHALVGHMGCVSFDLCSQCPCFALRCRCPGVTAVGGAALHVAGNSSHFCITRTVPVPARALGWAPPPPSLPPLSSSAANAAATTTATTPVTTTTTATAANTTANTTAT